MLYQIRDGKLTVGGKTILENFNFTIKGTEKAALVGANGAGKSVFLKMLAGNILLEKDERSSRQGTYTSGTITIGLLDQTPFAGSDRTVEEELLAACPEESLWDRGRFDYEQEYDRLFTGFGFSKEEKEKKLSAFSGGERTKIALIRLLLERPDLLLLDEPTNHLDLESIQWLESYLRTYPGAAVIVSHDRFFLDETASLVYELENGRLTRYAGNYSAYRKEKQRAYAAALRRWKRQEEEAAREEELIKRFRQKARKASFARARKKILDRMERMEKPQEAASHIFTGEISPLLPGPKWVLEAKDLQVGYEQTLFTLSLRVRRGQKIAIIGKNGAGKSTLLKIISGQMQPLGGSCQLGEGTDFAYFDQLSAQLTGEERVIDHFRARFPEVDEKTARQQLAHFLFRGELAGRKIMHLSGGEKSRLLLAEILRARPNVLILDEPTNHMDLPAKETLESAFQMYQGTMLFVSHDRYLISQIADALLVLEDGRALYYPFGYRHYLDKKKQPVEAENQALISGLRSVPKGMPIQSRRVSDQEASLEWQLEGAWESLELAEKELMICSRYCRTLRETQLRLFCEGESDPEKEAELGKAEEKLEQAGLACVRAAVLVDELQTEWEQLQEGEQETDGPDAVPDPAADFTDKNE